MPLYALICRDNPEMMETRMATREAHLAYARDSGAVVLGGPFIEDGQMAGSLVILDAADRTAAQAWADADPYHIAGLFGSSELSEWKKVIG